MYADNYPYLTFEDLVHATQKSAGLGQADINSLPLQIFPGSPTGQDPTDVYNQQLNAIAATGTSWQTLALVAGAILAGVFVLKGVSR